jgi:hypothetical protein
MRGLLGRGSNLDIAIHAATNIGSGIQLHCTKKSGIDEHVGYLEVNQKRRER